MPRLWFEKREACAEQLALMVCEKCEKKLKNIITPDVSAQPFTGTV